MADIPFSLSVSLDLPPDVGGEATPVTFAYSGTASSVVRYKLELTGSGTKALDFGTIPAEGAKLVLMTVAEGDNPVLVYVNGSATPEEVTSDGVKVLLSPTPSTGITSLSVEYSADASVSVWVLG